MLSNRLEGVSSWLLIMEKSNFDIKLILAYDYHQEVKTLFAEYNSKFNKLYLL